MLHSVVSLPCVLAYLSLFDDAKAADTGVRVVCVEKEPPAFLVDLVFEEKKGRRFGLVRVCCLFDGTILQIPCAFRLL